MYPKTKMTRIRQNKALASLATETYLTKNDFIFPMFIIEGVNRKEEIPSMPGVYRLSIDLAVKRIEKIKSPAVLLFGVCAEAHKDHTGEQAKDQNGLIPRAVRQIKKTRDDIAVITDVCFCAYTTTAHCGVVGTDGKIDNTQTLLGLSEMALAHSAAGADMVAPSAMADGQVCAIREKLDSGGFENTAIMSYSAKFASAFYEPFREAANSSPKFGNRTGYQLAPTNGKEAIREALADEAEGADWLMVKPGLPYIDVLKELKQKTMLPVASYQVSGEYAMIKAAAHAGALNERQTALESILCIKRAGADAIITYYAEDIIQWLNL